VATTQAWTRLERQWRAILRDFDVSVLHMRNFAHFRGEFSGWDDVRRRSMLGQLLPAMNQAVSAYIGESLILPSDWRNQPRARRDMLGDPYHGCLIYCFQILSSLEHSAADKVNVVVAEHPEFSARAAEIFRQAKQLPTGVRLGTLTLASPGEMPALQVADLVAYELLQYMTNLERGIERVRWPMEQIKRKEAVYFKRLRMRTEEEPL
jgi:hypothetical protein